MRKRRKILAGALLISLLCSGCKIGNTEVVLKEEEQKLREVFNIGGNSCDLTEAKVYLANYQNIYGKSYGMDLWEQKFQEEKLKKYIKDIALSELTRITCMDLLATEQEISLTEAEIDIAHAAAEQYYASLSQDEITYMEAEEADIAKMYEDYVLAQKVYDSLIGSVDEEVSDEEARIMEALQIYTTDKVKADEVAAKLQAGEDFAVIAGNYNEKAEMEMAFGRGDLPKEVEAVAFELDNEVVSGCIEAEDGYYFIKCINKFNEELTDANKLDIVEEREKAAFDDVYDKFVLGLDSTLNETLWNSVDLVTDGSIKTDSFFEIIEER